jgi:hypothetical protein
VRLEPKNAAVLFALVKQEKMANTHVVLTGETPTTAGVPVARRDNQRGTNNDYQRAFSNDPELDSTASVPQPRQRTVRTREYDDAPRYYYDRESPYYTAPRRYGDEQQPFGWPFGR